MSKKIKIAIAGLGTVGSGVLELLKKNKFNKKFSFEITALASRRKINLLKYGLKNSPRIIYGGSVDKKNIDNFKEVLFEGYSPQGIAILVETATDNNKRTVANLRSYFNKYNGSLSTSGSVEFMFDHKCNFRITFHKSFT